MLIAYYSVLALARERAAASPPLADESFQHEQVIRVVGIDDVGCVFAEDVRSILAKLAELGDVLGEPRAVMIDFITTALLACR